MNRIILLAAFYQTMPWMISPNRIFEPDKLVETIDSGATSFDWHVRIIVCAFRFELLQLYVQIMSFGRS